MTEKVARGFTIHFPAGFALSFLDLGSDAVRQLRDNSYGQEIDGLISLQDKKIYRLADGTTSRSSWFGSDVQFLDDNAKPIAPGDYSILLSENKVQKLDIGICSMSIKAAKQDVLSDADSNHMVKTIHADIPHTVQLVDRELIITLDVSIQMLSSSANRTMTVVHPISGEIMGSVPGVIQEISSLFPFETMIRTILIAQKQPTTVQRVIITGHGWSGSLAHAIAVLLREHLRAKDSSLLVKAISFGGPLIGDDVLMSYLQRNRHCVHHVTVNVGGDILDRFLWILQKLMVWQQPAAATSDEETAVVSLYERVHALVEDYVVPGPDDSLTLSLSTLLEAEAFLQQHAAISPVASVWLPLGRYCTRTVDNIFVAGVPETRPTCIESTLSSFDHTQRSYNAYFHDFHSSLLPPASVIPTNVAESLRPTLSSVSVLYQPQLRQITWQFSGENLDAVRGRGVNAAPSLPLPTSSAEFLSSLPFALHFNHSTTRLTTLLHPGADARIASILATWNEIFIHMVDCSLSLPDGVSTSTKDRPLATISLFTDYGESNTFSFTENDIIQPSSPSGAPTESTTTATTGSPEAGETASSSVLGTLRSAASKKRSKTPTAILHPTMNVSFLITAVLRIAAYGRQFNGISGLMDNRGLFDLWQLILALERTLLPSKKSKLSTMGTTSAAASASSSSSSSSELEGAVQHYWHGETADLAALRQQITPVLTDLAQKVVQPLDANENPAMMVTRKVAGLIGRVSGGVILSASALLMVPSTLLLAPVSSYIFPQSAESSSPRNTLSGPGRFGLGLYLGAAGILSFPGLVVGAVGYFISAVSKNALQDPESIQYKEILRSLLESMFSTDDSRHGGSSSSKRSSSALLRDVVDELCPLEDFLVHHFHSKYPEAHLTHASTSPQDIAQVINRHALMTTAHHHHHPSSQEDIAATVALQRYLKRSTGSLEKLWIVGKIYAMRRHLQNQLLLGFLGSRQSRTNGVIQQLFQPNSPTAAATTAAAATASTTTEGRHSITPIGTWIKEARLQSQSFDAFMNEGHRHEWQCLALSLSTETTSSTTTDENAETAAQMASMLVVLIAGDVLAWYLAETQQQQQQQQSHPPGSSTSPPPPMLLSPALEEAMEQERSLIRIAQQAVKPFMVVIDFLHPSTTTTTKASSRGVVTTVPSLEQWEHYRTVYAELLHVPENMLMILADPQPATATRTATATVTNDAATATATTSVVSAADTELLTVCQLRAALYGMVHNFLGDVTTLSPAVALHFLPSTTMHTLQTWHQETSTYHMPDLLATAAVSLIFSMTPMTAAHVNAEITKLVAEKRRQVAPAVPMSVLSSSSSTTAMTTAMTTTSIKTTTTATRLIHGGFWVYLEHLARSWGINEDVLQLILEILGQMAITLETELKLQRPQTMVLGQVGLRSSSSSAAAARDMTMLDALIGTMVLNELHDLLRPAAAAAASTSSTTTTTTGTRRTTQPHLPIDPIPPSSLLPDHKQQQQQQQRPTATASTTKPRGVESSASRSDYMMIELLLHMNDLVQYWLTQGYSLPAVRIALFRVFTTTTTTTASKTAGGDRGNEDEGEDDDEVTNDAASSQHQHAVELEAHILAVLEETQAILSFDDHYTALAAAAAAEDGGASSLSHRVPPVSPHVDRYRQYQIARAQFQQLQALTFPTTNATTQNGPRDSLNLNVNDNNNDDSTTANQITASIEKIAALKYIHSELLVISGIETLSATTATTTSHRTTEPGSSDKDDGQSNHRLLADSLLLQLLSLPMRSNASSSLYTTEWRFQIQGEAAVDAHGVTRSLLTKVAEDIYRHPRRYFLRRPNSSSDGGGRGGNDDGGSVDDERGSGSGSGSGPVDNGQGDVLYFDPHVCYFCDYYTANPSLAEDASIRLQIATVKQTYRALGHLVGLVLRNVPVGVTLPIRFATTVYTWLLGGRIGYRDVQSLSPSLATSMEAIAMVEDDEIMESMDLTFAMPVTLPACYPSFLAPVLLTVNRIHRADDEERLLPIADATAAVASVTGGGGPVGVGSGSVGGGATVERAVTRSNRLEYLRLFMQYHLCCLHPPVMQPRGMVTSSTSSSSSSSLGPTATAAAAAAAAASVAMDKSMAASTNASPVPPLVVQEFVLGVQEMCPRDTWHDLTPWALQAMIEGESVIDVAQWKATTKVQSTAHSMNSLLTSMVLTGTVRNTDTNTNTNSSGRTAATNTAAAAASKTSSLEVDDAVLVEQFWEIVEELSPADRQRLLCFTIGTTSVPAVTGFAGLDPPFTLIIASTLDPTSLPVSHTCFHMLILPKYPTKEILRDKLLLAFRETGADHMGIV